MKPLCSMLLLMVMLASTAHADILIRATDGTVTKNPTINTLAQASSASSAAGKTVICTSPQTLSTNLTLGSDRAYEFKKGCVITTTGHTFNGNGAPFSAGDYQIFAGTGTVTGIRGRTLSWFGITPEFPSEVNVVGDVGQYHIQDWSDMSGAVRMSIGEIGAAGSGPALKVVAPSTSQTVEIAMCQSTGTTGTALRNYGGYFMIDPTTSDFSWSSRTNNADHKRLVIKNSDGAIAIGLDDPKSVNGTTFAGVRLNVRNPVGTGSGGGTYQVLSNSEGYVGLLLNDETQTTDAKIWGINTNPTPNRLDISKYDDAGSGHPLLSVFRSTGNVYIGTSPTDATSSKLTVDGKVTVASGGLTVASGDVSINGAFQTNAMTGHTNHATCWKSGGYIGYCSTVIASDGTCTCN